MPIRILVTGLLLAGAWLLWSGHNDALLFAFGAGSVLLVVGLSRRMDRVAEAPRVYTLGLRPLAYLPWLLWEIVKANLAVARLILDPSLPIAPRLVRVRALQKTPLGQTIFANSITLTPGTLSLEVEDGSVLVHALTAESAAGVLEGSMNRRVARLEGEG